LADEAVRTMIGGIARLPTPPRTYMAVTRALEDPNSALPDIAALIEQDIASCAKVLQIVNSAFFGLRQPVTSIKQALSYLGANMVRRVLLSAETFSMYQGETTPNGFSLSRLQEHAIAVAAVAGTVLADKIKGEDAFMAGMLHDVGQLILAVHCPDAFASALATARQKGVPLHVAEREIYHATHAEIGAFLLGIWGLPYPIVEAVAHHHDPARVHHQTFDVIDAAYVAEWLVQDAQGAGAPDFVREDLDVGYLERLGVAGQLAGWKTTAARAVAEASAS
jgi:HD-like signal output (HDOD) protein